MKRKTPKEILSASFQELAAVKSIDKITIQEIVDNCGYSPATFYRYFKDKYDLIAWEYARSVAAIVDQTSAANYPWKQTFYDGARMYQANKDYLVNLRKLTSVPKKPEGNTSALFAAMCMILRSMMVSHSRSCPTTGSARAANSQRINSIRHDHWKIC